MARAKISAIPGRSRTVASMNLFISSPYQGMAGRPASTRAARATPTMTVHQSSESHGLFSFDSFIETSL
jgi:hypothetical protein